jgi:uncharacterized glyoxalase superfamily protein PhnB
MAKLSRIAPELPVTDLPEAIKHYEQKLGFKCVMLMPKGDYAIVERDAVAIHLFQDETHNCTPVGIHIFTAELEALHAELQQRGARMLQGIVRRPWGNRDFRLKDEFGNEIKFTEPLAQD